MKIGLTIVLLLVVITIISAAKKSSSSKSKPAESPKTARKEVYSKKTVKTYSKSKKPSSAEEVPQFTKKSSSRKTSKSNRDVPEVSQPPRHQKSGTKRQPEVQPERVIYEEDFVTEERYPADDSSYQKTYRKQQKMRVHRQQYDCHNCHGQEETMPAVRGPSSCPFRPEGDSPPRRCPYQAESQAEQRPCAGPAPPAMCNQQPPVTPPCPYAAVQQPCPTCNQPIPSPACPCAAANQPPSQTQMPPQQPQAYPTININTYSGTPVIKDSAIVVNESEAANSTSSEAGDNISEEAEEEDEEEEAVETEETVVEEAEEEEIEEPQSKSGKYASCADPELSEEMDDGYCYRTEL